MGKPELFHCMHGGMHALNAYIGYNLCSVFKVLWLAGIRICAYILALPSCRKTRRAWLQVTGAGPWGDGSRKREEAFRNFNSVKKVECRRTDAFELRCCRRLLRVPWTAKGSNQSILKEINPEYSLEGLILKLKLQHFGHLIQRIDSLEKTLMLERLKAGEGDDRGWDGGRTWWTWVWASSGNWWWTGKPGMLQSMGSQSRTWLSD